MREYAKPKRIYWVFDKTTLAVVYVGISEHPHYRMSCHYNSKSNPGLRDWLRSNSDNFDYRISEEIPDENEARRIEHIEIAKFKNIGQAKFNRSK